jgi:hypothetical protein
LVAYLVAADGGSRSRPSSRRIYTTRRKLRNWQPTISAAKWRMQLSRVELWRSSTGVRLQTILVERQQYRVAGQERVLLLRTPCLLSPLGKPAVASTFGCCERSASRGRPTYARSQYARRILCSAPGGRRSVTKAQRRPGHTRRFPIPSEIHQHPSLGCIERICARPRRWCGIHHNLQTSINRSPQHQWGCYPTISTEADGSSTQHSILVARKSWFRR